MVGVAVIGKGKWVGDDLNATSDNGWRLKMVRGYFGLRFPLLEIGFQKRDFADSYSNDPKGQLLFP